MKLTELLEGLGNPVQFYPDLVHITGSHQAAIFLGQLCYWTGKQRSKDGWIYKTQEQWQLETELTEKEQKNARNLLIERKLIQERFKGVPRRLEYQINSQAINIAWEDWVPAMRIKRWLIDLMREYETLESRGLTDELLSKRLDLLRKGLSACRKKQEKPETIEKSIISHWEMQESPSGRCKSRLVGDARVAQTEKLSVYTENTQETTHKAPPEPGAPPTQKREGVEEEFHQNGNGNRNVTKEPQQDSFVTSQDLTGIHEETTVSGEDKNSAALCDNSAFVGHGNIAPDGKPRILNQMTGKWQSSSSDPWMNGCNPDRAFKKWVCDRALANGKSYTLSDASGEIRNNFQRAGDLWEEYQEELARSRKVEEMKQPVAAVPEAATQAPSQQNGQFNCYRAFIQNRSPLLKSHRERGIEWAKEQPNVVLIYDDQGEVIDIEEF